MAKKLVQTISAPATVTEGGKAKPQIIAKVKDGLKLRGARAAWYELLQKHEGKPVQDFLAAATKTPPSMPKSGVPEKASGWFRYFVRSGIASVQ